MLASTLHSSIGRANRLGYGDHEIVGDYHGFVIWDHIFSMDIHRRTSHIHMVATRRRHRESIDMTATERLIENVTAEITKAIESGIPMNRIFKAILSAMEEQYFQMGDDRNSARIMSMYKLVD